MARVRRCARLLLAILWVCLAPIAKADPATNYILPVRLSDGTIAELNLSANPALADCRQSESSADRQLWTCTDYSLELRTARDQGADLVSFSLKSLSGNRVTLHEYSARVVVPAAPGDALFTYNRLPLKSIMETDIARSREYVTAANRGIPYLALVDRQGLNRLAVGLLSQDHMVYGRSEPGESGQNFALSVLQADAAAGALFEDTFYISLKKESWFRNAQTYTQAVDRSRGYTAPPMPDAVFNPTFDSWYWTMDKINQNLVWDLATRSQAVGFKTYFLDAGWDTHAGQWALWLNGSTGDYTPPPESFPDLRGLIDRIRGQLGMKVMLWMQQYAMGRRSIYYPELGGLLSYTGDGDGAPQETATLCPRMDGTRRHMIDLFGRILENYRPDAFWFDWQEDIPARCAAPHLHDYPDFGEGYNATQQEISRITRQYVPDVFVDMRWPFANLNNKPYTHLWQPTDTPDDFEAMRLRAMAMRPFSAGVVIGTDEMYWSPTIPDAEAARFMATVVFTGVPYFGPNLIMESATRTEMLRAWLRFYEANREDLTTGKFSPYGKRDEPDQFIEGKRATFIYYGRRLAAAVPMTRANRKIFIVNASRFSDIDLTVNGLKPGNYRIDVSDLSLRNLPNSRTENLLKKTRLQFPVPTGCLLTLTYIP